MVRDLDFYKILNIAPSASFEEIRSAYRNLARKYHPDLNSGNPHSEEMFKLINVAYEVLKDPEQRKKFDFLRAYGVQFQNPFARNPTDPELEEIMRVYLQQLDQLFSQWIQRVHDSINTLIGTPFRLVNLGLKTLRKFFIANE